MNLGKRMTEVLEAVGRGVVWRVTCDDEGRTWYDYRRSDPQPEGHGWPYMRWAGVRGEVQSLVHRGLVEVSTSSEDVLTDDGGESVRMLLTAKGRGARFSLVIQAQWDGWPWAQWAEGLSALVLDAAELAEAGNRENAEQTLAAVEAEVHRRRATLRKLP